MPAKKKPRKKGRKPPRSKPKKKAATKTGKKRTGNIRNVINVSYPTRTTRTRTRVVRPPIPPSYPTAPYNASLATQSAIPALQVARLYSEIGRLRDAVSAPSVVPNADLVGTKMPSGVGSAPPAYGTKPPPIAISNAPPPVRVPPPAFAVESNYEAERRYRRAESSRKYRQRKKAELERLRASVGKSLPDPGSGEDLHIY